MMKNETAKYCSALAAALLLTVVAGPAAALNPYPGHNTNTTIQEGDINTNDSWQRGERNNNATYQQGLDNANRTRQRGSYNWNEAGQFGKVNYNRTEQQWHTKRNARGKRRAASQ